MCFLSLPKNELTCYFVLVIVAFFVCLFFHFCTMYRSYRATRLSFCHVIAHISCCTHCCFLLFFYVLLFILFCIVLPCFRFRPHLCVWVLVSLSFFRCLLCQFPDYFCLSIISSQSDIIFNFSISSISNLCYNHVHSIFYFHHFVFDLSIYTIKNIAFPLWFFSAFYMLVRK